MTTHCPLCHQPIHHPTPVPAAWHPHAAGPRRRLSARLVEVAQALHDAPNQIGRPADPRRQPRDAAARALAAAGGAGCGEGATRRSRCWSTRSWCTRARRGGRGGRRLKSAAGIGNALKRIRRLLQRVSDAHFASVRTPDCPYLSGTDRYNPARAFEGECVPYLELPEAAAAVLT